MSKLVVLSRADLSTAQQAVQATHAAINFIFEHPGRASPWFSESNYLVLLSVNDEEELLEFTELAREKDIKTSLFQEPDLNNEFTAVALEPSKATQKLVQKLPLMFKNKNNE